MQKCLNNWLAVVVLAILVGTALAGAAQAQAFEREFHQTFELNPDGTVSLINSSGYIRVTSWNEKNRVQVDAVKQTRREREEDWSQVEIRVTSRPDRLEITTIYPRGRSNNTSVNYDLKVPRSAVLNSINSTSGDVTISGPVARVVARSTSGNVTATDVGGDANLSSTSGNARAERIGGGLSIGSTSGNVTVNEVGSRLNARSTSGNIRISQARDDAIATCSSGSIKMERIGARAVANTTSGWINITGVSGDVEAHAHSDGVTVEDVRGRVIASSLSGNVSVRKVDEGVRAVSTSANVEIASAKGRLEAETISGSITLRDVDSHDLRLKSLSSSVQYQGKLYADGRYEFNSFSGNVIVTIPADSEFNLTAQTFSGSINTEFPLQITTGKLSARGPIQGVVGKGGAQVKAESFSGNVHIKKLVAQAR
jgi:hypothetical protein